MANTLRFKRGLASGIPTALAGEPLFTTDTFDLYIGNGTSNTRFQKYIASGATTQILRGDGSLYTFPLAISSPSTGQVLKYNGTSWVNDSDSGITGSLTTNYLPKATGATTLGNSLIWDNGTTIGINTTSVNSNEKLRIDGGRLVVLGGTDVYQLKLSYNSATSGFWMGSPSANALSFYNDAGTERARFHSTGNFGIGTGATDSGQKLQVVGTGYFSDSVGIGSTSLTGFNLRVSKNITGSTVMKTINQEGTVQSDVTNLAFSFLSSARTAAAAFTLSNYYHYYAEQYTLGAGSAVTNQFGFVADNTLTGATNNFGFYGNIAAATGRWNLYMNGTANNYLAGNTGIGTTGATERLVVRAIGNSYANSAALSIENNTGANKTYLTNANGVFYLTNSTSADHIALYSTGNLVLSGTSDSGERLQVTGTMKVTGALGGTTATFTATNTQLTLVNTSATGYASTTYNTLSRTYVTGVGGASAGVTDTRDSYYIYDNTAGVTRLVINASGNLGLGVTPSSWAASRSKIEFSSAGTTAGFVGCFAGSSANNQMGLGSNAYYNASSVWTYSNTGGGAGYYAVKNNVHEWHIAPSGTAGNAITFTQAMTLDASGRLGIGVTSPTESLQVNGAVRITGAITNNTTGGILAYQGSGNTLLGAWGVDAATRGLITFYLANSTGTTGSEFMRLNSTGNLLIRSTTDSGEALQVTGTAKITGATTFGSSIIATGLISSATEFRLNNQAFSKVAILDAGGGFAGGYNFNLSGGTPQHSLTGAISGVYYGSGGTINFYTGTSQTAGTTATSRMLLDASGNLYVDTNTLFVDATANEVGIGTNAPNSVLHVVGSVSKSISDVKTANYTATASDHTILCSAASGAITITLPAASGIAGRIYVIKKTNASSGVNSVTVDGNGSETIDGSASINLSCKSSVTLQCDGSNWHILSLYSDTSCL